jgi:hypothetical protein
VVAHGQKVPAESAQNATICQFAKLVRKGKDLRLGRRSFLLLNLSMLSNYGISLALLFGNASLSLSTI